MVKWVINYPLQCWHPTWAPMCVLAALLPIQLSANGLQKAAQDSPVLPQYTPGRLRRSFCLWALAWPSSGHRGCIRNDPADKRLGGISTNIECSTCPMLFSPISLSHIFFILRHKRSNTFCLMRRA